MVANKIREPLPPHIQADMRNWREQGCWSPCPPSYIEFHKGLAEQERDRLSGSHVIHNSYMADDGWFDGMKVLHVIAEDRKTGALLKLKWHDTNRGFMQAFPSGGWGIFP